MKYEINLPEVFHTLKKEVPAFKNAVVAGGYLRNRLYGIEPKDLDIFVPCLKSTDFNAFMYGPLETINKVGLFRSKQKDNNGEYVNTNLRGQFNFVTKDGLEVDIMPMKLAVEGFGNNLIETFPFANQQIFHDGKRVYTSDRFNSDLNNGTMTLVNCRTLVEFPKLFKKYEELSSKYDLRFMTDYVLAKRNGDDWL